MKKRNIIHSALSLSLTAALCLSMAACGGTQPPADSSAASAAPAQPAAVQPAAEEPTSTALPVKALHPKQVDENPYMAKSDANIHHDGYNTDSTDITLRAVLRKCKSILDSLMMPRTPLTALWNSGRIKAMYG